MLLENVLKELELAYDYYEPLSVNWTESVESFPVDLDFLEEAFLLEVLGVAEIKEADTITAVKKVSKVIKSNSFLKLLLYHAHRTLVAYDEKNIDNLAKYPDLDKCLGKFSGIFYLILALSSINAIKESFAKRHIAEKYALACLQWVAGTIQIYRIGHNNVPGHNQSQTYWIRHYIEGCLFRIGRLEFMDYCLTDEFPFVFRHNNTGEIVTLCGNDWELDKEGFRMISDKAYMKSELSRDSRSITGIPISEQGKALVDKKITILNEDYTQILAPGDFALALHIPGGKKMDIQSVRQSFTQAKEFYKKHFPKKKFKAFTCLSWLLNPDYIEYLPNSNIVRFMQEGTLFPSISSGRDGLFPIFGRDYSAIDNLPTDNTMQKTMKYILQTKGTLHSGGIYILVD